MLGDSRRDVNILTFVRFALASRVMIKNHKDNADSFLRKGRQFVGEFSDPLQVEVETMRWRDGHLKQDCDVFEDANAVDRFCG